MTQTNKIVILEKQTRQSVLMTQLKQQPSITDTTYVSLNVFLNTLIHDERNQDWFTCAKIIQDKAQVSGILEKTLRYPVSIDHLMSFMLKMNDEGWTIDDCPETNPKEKALKLILNELWPHFQRRAQQWDQFNQLNLKHVTIYDHFYDYAIHQRLHKMVEKGLTLNHLPKKEPSVKLMFAKNPRSEAQACVQHMLSDDLPYDQQVVVCLDNDAQSNVEAFLIHHEIPYFRVNEHKTTAAFRLFTDLLKLRLEPNHSNLVTFIENDHVALPSRINAIQYLNAFSMDVGEILTPLNHVKSVFSNSTLGDVFDERSYLELEKKAEFELHFIRDNLATLMALDPHAYVLFIQNFFDIYIRFFKTFSDEDIQSINTIKTILEEGHSILETMKDPYEILLYLIEKQTITTKQSTGVILTDLKHAYVFGKTRAYFLGCTQDGYPQVTSNSGLFDDDYLSKIKGIEVQARYDDHMACLKDLRTAFDEVIYSYPMGNYEGKAQKLPYELEHYFEKMKVKAQAWKIAEKYPVPKNVPIVLSKTLAKKLYFPKDELYGSVSSFERFFKCPYQYFLSNGLGLRDQNDYDITNREMGNLMHAVLEEGVKEFGKQYSSSLRGTEEKRLSPYFEDMKRLFPKRTTTIELMRGRSIILLKLTLEFLDSREKNTVFSPYGTEKRFDEVIDVDGEYPLHLVGTIDRIDTMENGFMIIDYKSSNKILKENHVMEGTQLQLCTYLWIGKDHLKLGVPYGIFYFSFGQKSVVRTALNETELEKLWKDGRRFVGWLTDDPSPVDFDGSHHKGLSKKENNTYAFYGGSFKADAIILQMKTLYKLLMSEIADGRINKQNKDGSCMFCDFKSFCQFKGAPVKFAKINKDQSVLR